MFYFGNIHGKLLENTNLKKCIPIEPKTTYFYFKCNCEVVNFHNDYCKKCFNNYDEHKEKIENKDKIYKQPELYYKTDFEKYILDDSHLEIIKYHIYLIKPLIQEKIIELLDNIKDNEEITNYGNICFDNIYLYIQNNINNSENNRMNIYYITVIIFYYQIQYCLENYSMCLFYV